MKWVSDKGDSSLTATTTYKYEEAKYSMELTGWTHTRKYATGYLRAGVGDALVRITGLSRARLYVLDVYQVVSQNGGTHEMKIYNGESVSVTSSTNREKPVWSGEVTSDCDGSILLTFVNAKEGTHVQFSGLKLAACAPPDDEHVTKFCSVKTQSTLSVVMKSATTLKPDPQLEKPASPQFQAARRQVQQQLKPVIRRGMRRRRGREAGDEDDDEEDNWEFGELVFTNVGGKVMADQDIIVTVDEDDENASDLNAVAAQVTEGVASAMSEAIESGEVTLVDSVSVEANPQWGEWKANEDGCVLPSGATCGDGQVTNVRVCEVGECVGETSQTVACTIECNGGYSDWSQWNTCSATCGGGTMSRTRTCTNPTPSANGVSCVDGGLGEPSETNACNEDTCPIGKVLLAYSAT